MSADAPLLVPTSLSRGRVVRDDDGQIAVNVAGGNIPAYWTLGSAPRVGDDVAVLSIDGMAVVLDAISQTPSPATGLVSGEPEDGRIPVTSADGVTVMARYVELEDDVPPDIDTRVALLWQNSDPIIVAGPLVPVLGDPVPPAPPAGGGSTGPTRLHLQATAAGSWRPFGWEHGVVKQGAYSGAPSNRGAWFHGYQAAQIAGRTVTRLQMMLGGRDGSAGSYNAALPAHFYVASGTGPNNWSGIAGPVDITIPAASWGGGWIDLPPTWAPLLAAGNGIGIAGSPYLGISGSPPSGLLAIDLEG